MIKNQSEKLSESTPLPRGKREEASPAGLLFVPKDLSLVGLPVKRKHLE